MKRLFALIVCLAILIPSLAFSAGTVTVTRKAVVPQYVEQVVFTCTGDSSSGSIPNTAITQEMLRYINGMYLYCVTAYPTSGGTAPDAADVFILNQNSEDLLGSADNTTAGNGASLIHATLTRTTLPKLYLPSVNFFPVVNGLLTLKVSNQSTASANYTVVLTFVK